MLDFVKAMEIADRICKKMTKTKQCEACPLRVVFNDGLKHCCFVDYTCSVKWQEIETALIAWDKAYPAPVYPTWEEWQESICKGAHTEIDGCCFSEKDCLYTNIICSDCRQQPIPADIAKKLGIKPKEG